MSYELQDVNGIIFKRKKYKEADVLCKIISKEKGIVTLDVRGALRPKSQLGASTLNFSYGNYTINTSDKGISTLRTFKGVSQFENIYLDMFKQAYASYILDLFDHAFLEYQELDGYYDLAFWSLEKIDEKQDPEIIKQVVQLKLLHAYGVAPNFKECVICGKRQGTFDFSLELGGIICSDHFNSGNPRMHLHPKTVALIRTLALVDHQKISKIKISDELKKESKKAIDLMYRQYLDLNLKSKKFLDEMVVL